MKESVDVLSRSEQHIKVSDLIQLRSDCEKARSYYCFLHKMAQRFAGAKQPSTRADPVGHGERC